MKLILFLLLILLLVSCAGPQLELLVPKGIQTTVYLNKDQSVKPATKAFDISPEGLPFEADGQLLRPLMASGQKQRFEVSSIDDFSWMGDGTLLIISKNSLLQGEAESLSVGPSLPEQGMHIRPAGEAAAYIFDGNATATNHTLYLLRREAGFTKLVTLPYPITAVAGDGDTTYVATGKTVVRLQWDQSTEVVYVSNFPIVSLELAPEEGLFFSTQSAVWFLSKEGRALEFVRGFGGQLRLRNEALFLFSSSHPYFFRFTNLSAFRNLDGASRE